MTMIEARPSVDRVVLSEHARGRAAEMGIPTKRIKRGLPTAEFDYPSQADYLDGCRMAQFDDLAVPYVVRDRVALVITVLWRSYEPTSKETRATDR